jgi:hypothetical protein
MLSVVVELLGRLCLLQAVAYISQEGLVSLHVLGEGGHPRLPWLIRVDGRRVTAIYHAERACPGVRSDTRCCRCTRPTATSTATSGDDLR